MLQPHTLTQAEERALIVALGDPEKVTHLDLEVLSGLHEKLARRSVERQREAAQPANSLDMMRNVGTYRMLKADDPDLAAKLDVIDRAEVHLAAALADDPDVSGAAA